MDGEIGSWLDATAFLSKGIFVPKSTGFWGLPVDISGL